MVYDITIEGKNYRLELDRVEGRWRCQIDGRSIEIDALLASPNVVSVLMDGKAYEIKREQSATDTHLWVGNRRYLAEPRDPRSLQAQRSKAGDTQGPKKLIAPMPGKVVRILLTEGADVVLGQGILVMEAMKMQNEIKSPKKGKLQKLMVQPGGSVNAGDVLAIVD